MSEVQFMNNNEENIFVSRSFESDIVKESQQILAEEINNSIHMVRILSSSKQIINFCTNGINNIFYLAAGEIELHNIDNKMIIANMNAPAILGVTTMFTNDERYYIKTVRDAEFYSVATSDFIKTVEQKKLWKFISVILSHNLSIYYHRDLLLSQSNVYGIIRNQLEEIWEQSQSCNEDVSVFDYILHRTPVSRSSLNKVLKDLVTGGYIKLNRGRLIHLKKLPTGY